MIVTDGVDQDDPRGIWLTQLRASRKSAADPARPVRLVVAVLSDATGTQDLGNALTSVPSQVAALTSPRQLHALMVRVATEGG